MKEIKYIQELLILIEEVKIKELNGSRLLDIIDAINWLKQIKQNLEKKVLDQQKKQARPLDDEDEEE